MPELIYIKSHVMSAITIAKRLNDRPELVQRLEAAYAVVCTHQQREIEAFGHDELADNVLVLASYRLTERWKKQI